MFWVRLSECWWVFVREMQTHVTCKFSPSIMIKIQQLSNGGENQKLLTSKCGPYTEKLF